MKLALKILTVFAISIIIYSCVKKDIPSTAVNQVGGIQINDSSEHEPIVGINIGNKAPDLNIKDSNGVFIRLSSIKGKIILIDFWASWCGSCKIENNSLIDVYKTFKDTAFKNSNGFEIYSVSIDSNRSRWLLCLNGFGYSAYTYNWKYNVLDGGDWNSNALKLYNINSIPMNYLIDQKGIIIAKDLRDTMVTFELKKLLLK